MSYILNALRKSEQERQQQKQEHGLQARLSVDATGRRRFRAGWLVAGLVIVNLTGLAYVLIQSTQEVSVNPVQIQPPQSNAAIKSIELPETTGIAVSTQKKLTKEDAVSIAELIKSKSKPIPTKETIEKPAIKQIVPVVIAEQQPEQKTVIKPRQITMQQPVVRQDLPWLSDLPAAFRRSVPGLNINVYVYADDPDNRFIMVDMQKYGNDQEIKEGMILKAIHPDGIVVEYRQKRFKIRRD